MTTLTNTAFSHRNRVGTTKTVTAIHCSAASPRSAIETPPSQFVVAAWLDWIFSKVSDVRRCNVDRTFKDAALVELSRRNYTREDAVTAELYLLTAEWTAAKNNIGLEISDFFRDKVEITKAELTAMRAKAYRNGFSAGKSENTVQMKLTDDEKPLLTAITECQAQNFVLIERIRAKDKEIHRLRRRLERLNLNFDENSETENVQICAETCRDIRIRVEEGIEI